MRTPILALVLAIMPVAAQAAGVFSQVTWLRCDFTETIKDRELFRSRDLAPTAP